MNSPKKTLQVFFSTIPASPKKGQVLIFPDNDSWNDFGFKIRCEFSVKLSLKSPPIEGKLFIGFLPTDKSRDTKRKKVEEQRISLSDVLLEKRRDTLPVEDAPFFFSLLPSMNSYRQVVEKLGPKDAAVFLTAINDLVISNQTRQAWIDGAVTSQVFTQGFMRDSEPFFAFSNADSILGGLENEDLSGISKELTLEFSLDGYDNEHIIKFRFSNGGLIPRRINILIGKNGAGKSQALKFFCRAALRYRDKEVRLIDDKNDRPMISRILAIATPGETKNTFPTERKATQKLFYRRLNLTRNGGSKVSSSLGNALVQLARSTDSIGEFSRWRLFYETLEKVLPVDSICIAQKSGGYIHLGALNEPGSETAKLDQWANISPNADPRVRALDTEYPLSSGQLTFFKFCLLLCRYIENGSFVLMDEPETHLHPNMISEFVLLLDYLLENTGSQAILATHSAYLVREVPKEQVHVFHEPEKGTINITNPTLKTFGAPVDAISQFVFEEDADIQLIEKIFRKVSQQTFGEVQLELKNELSLAALMQLRRRMEQEQ